MYARSYFGNSEISLPENYDGTAFSEDSIQKDTKTPKIESAKNEIKFSPKNDTAECSSPCQEDTYECSSPNKQKDKNGLFGIDFKGMFKSVFPENKLTSFFSDDFGIEEILIIGTALFLLFSPERDIECALLLLALIFIK